MWSGSLLINITPASERKVPHKQLRKAYCKHLAYDNKFV